ALFHPDSHRFVSRVGERRDEWMRKERPEFFDGPTPEGVPDPPSRPPRSRVPFAGSAWGGDPHAWPRARLTPDRGPRSVRSYPPPSRAAGTSPDPIPERRVLRLAWAERRVVGPGCRGFTSDSSGATTRSMSERDPSLPQADPEIHALIVDEHRRQRESLRLSASQNYAA